MPSHKLLAWTQRFAALAIVAFWVFFWIDHSDLPPAIVDMEWCYRSLGIRSRPLLTRHAVYLLARNQEFPIDKAVNTFGWNPTISLEEGIERSVAWLRETGI